MQEMVGDIWQVYWESHRFDFEGKGYDAMVITTNGTVSSSGVAVMGRGIAKEARDKFRGIDKEIGELVQTSGNRPYRLKAAWGYFDIEFITLPVKHNWWERADITLIERSIRSMRQLVGPKEKIIMPRPGCGNGKLEWKHVKPRIEHLLDDRFTVITNEGLM